MMHEIPHEHPTAYKETVLRAIEYIFAHGGAFTSRAVHIRDVRLVWTDYHGDWGCSICKW